MCVFFITFLVAIPFMFMIRKAHAIRISNAIAVALLFPIGYAFGRIAECRPWVSTRCRQEYKT